MSWRVGVLTAAILGMVATSCGDPANAIIAVRLNACGSTPLLPATSIDVTLTDGTGRRETHSYPVQGIPAGLSATLPGGTTNPVTVDVVAKGTANQQGSASTTVTAGGVNVLDVCLTPQNNGYKVTATLTGTPVKVAGLTPDTTGFRVDSFKFQTPGASDRTRFADVILIYTETLLSDTSQAVLVAVGPVSMSQTVTVTICNAIAVGTCNPGQAMLCTFQCRSEVPPQQTIAQVTADGSLVGALASTLIGPLTVDNFNFNGTIDMTTGKLSGFIDGVLTVAKYCDFSLPTGGLCPQQTVQLLDLLDGPTENCGIDSSVTQCTPSSDAAGHHPPDAFIQAQ